MLHTERAVMPLALLVFRMSDHLEADQLEADHLQVDLEVGSNRLAVLTVLPLCSMVSLRLTWQFLAPHEA